MKKILIRNPSLNPIVIIGLVSLYVTIGQFTSGVYLPSLPHIASDFVEYGCYANWTLTLYYISYGASQFFYGPFTDRFGRFKTMYFGLSIFIIGCVLSISSASLKNLVLSCFVQGIGIGSAGVLCRAIPRDLYSGKKLLKINSWINIIFVVTPLLAPILGGAIQQYLGWRFNFLFLFI